MDTNETARKEAKDPEAAVAASGDKADSDFEDLDGADLNTPITGFDQDNIRMEAARAKALESYKEKSTKRRTAC